MGVYGRLNTGLQVNASISPLGDVDQYRTTLIQGLTYTFTAYGASSGNGSLVDPHMSLLNASGQQIAYGDDISSTNRDARISWTAGSTGDFLINVGENGNNATGTYKFQISPGYASNYNDRVSGTIYGDAIAGQDGHDYLGGRGGNDYLYGQNGNDTLEGGDGHDYLEGGNANDILRGQNGNDTLVGGAGEDRLEGGNLGDVLHGGANGDILHGGAGPDQLIGGAGADRFIFTAVSDSTPSAPDIIRAGDGAIAFEGVGVNGGDVIGLSSIDANPTLPGDQAFTFSAQMGMGTVALYNAANGDTVLIGSIDADAEAEFMLRIADGNITAEQYRANDFSL